MRNYIFCVLVILFSGLLLGGCAKKEVVKAEDVAPATVVAAPEPPPIAVPAPPPAPEPIKSEVIQDQKVIPAAPQTTVTDEKITLDTIYFDFDKSDLRYPDRDVLTRNGRAILDKLKGNVQIEGHCDERGSAEYNLALGERRARSAMKYLVTLGVPADRLSIISYGEEKPADTGHYENAWSKNRRAQFVTGGQ